MEISNFDKFYNTLIEKDYINKFNLNYNEPIKFFSIPMLYLILFIMTSIKFVLNLLYFTIQEITLANFTMTVLFILLSLSFLLFRFSKRTRLYKDTFYKFANCSYIFLFTVETNFTIYYYDQKLFELNPGFIFFFFFLIIFYIYQNEGMKKFNEILFANYILNLVTLLYFFSLENFMGYFMPTNLVICMLVLLNIISNKNNKKLAKIKLFHDFFQQLITLIFKNNEMYIVNENKIILTLQEDVIKQNQVNLQLDNLETEKTEKNEYSLVEELSQRIDTIMEKDYKKIKILGFEEIFLVYRNDTSDDCLKRELTNETGPLHDKDYKIKLFGFINLLLFLSKSNELKDTTLIENQFDDDFEKDVLRYFDVKNMNGYNSLKLRSRIILVLVMVIIEKYFDDSSIKLNEFIVDHDIVIQQQDLISFRLCEDLESSLSFARYLRIIRELSINLGFVLEIIEKQINIKC